MGANERIKRGGDVRVRGPLCRRNDELRQTSKSKNRYTMLSHDLRTPLARALITAAELANDAALPEHAREDVRLIHRKIELELLMIDSLLDLTRISSGKLRIDARDVEVHGVLRAPAVMCTAEASAKSMHLHLQPRAAGSAMRADPAKLQQVFRNLFKNAIKFCEAGSQITVCSSD